MTRTRLCIVYLEDDPHDVELLELSFACAGVDVSLHVVQTREEFLSAMQSGKIEAIMSDCGLPTFPGRAALEIAREQYPHVPFIFLSGHLGDEQAVEALRRSGAMECIDKSRMQDAVALVQSVVERGKDSIPVSSPPVPPPPAVVSPPSTAPLVMAPEIPAMKRLVQAIQELALARSLEDVQGVVRRAARELVRADGATFVLRDGDQCHYADENAISPLWKGKRFPMTSCISGWVMLHRRPVVIDDIYRDSRIPAEAYRPTFVKSLAMVPIRTLDPVGAIGIYWATHRRCPPEQLELLHALADSTAVAMENVRVLTELEDRVRWRTVELEAANKELEAFSYAVSHDLRAPLRHITGFAEALRRTQADRLDDRGQENLGRILKSAERMSGLIGNLLELSRVTRKALQREKLDLVKMVQEILAELRAGAPPRDLDLVCPDNLVVEGDPGLMRAALDNLLSNAWKFTSRRERTRIELGVRVLPDGRTACFVQDNGAGFDPSRAASLFVPFQRLHSQSEFPGTGVGLATVQRIIARHGGRIWAESAPDQGSTFFFTLGGEPPSRAR